MLFELLAVAGISLFASTEGGWWPVAPFLLLYGIGVGLATAQLTGVIMVDVPRSKIGQASGSQSTVRQIGSALGIAVLGTILFTATQGAAESRLLATEALSTMPAAQQAEFIEGLSTTVVDSSGGFLPMIQPTLIDAGAPEEVATEIQNAANDGFTDGVKATGWAAAGFLFLGLLSTFSMGTRRRKDEKTVTEANV